MQHIQLRPPPLAIQAPRRHVHRRGSGEPKGPCDVCTATTPVWRGADQLPSRSVSAILAAVLLRLRLPRLLPISYFHHEESPELEEGHGEAQYGASRPCHQQGPNADILYPRQVVARLSPYPPISSYLLSSRTCSRSNRLRNSKGGFPMIFPWTQCL